MANLQSFPGAAPHPTSDVATTPFPIALGTRLRDASGNEYVYCDFTGPVYNGVTVSISNDGNFTAAALTNSHRGSVGIACGAGTSDNAGWVQIYGRHANAQLASGDSAASSTMVCVAASSVSSPAAGMDAIAGTSDEVHQIFGMWPTAAASTATTSATSHTGVDIAVWLNYPYVLGWVTGVIDPTT